MLQFTLTGRLVVDPELTTYGPDHTPMARLRVASNQPGSERPDFFDVVVFGANALAKLAAARRGDNVKLKGSGRQHFWVTDSNEQRQGISLAARSVEHTPRTAPTADTARHAHTATASATR